MSKETAANCFKERNAYVGASKKEIRKMIRVMADDEETFENIVFELGCSVLAKKLIKQQGYK